MVARNRARYLAPVLLAAVIVGTYMIVHNGLATHHATTSHVQTLGGTKTSRGRSRRVTFYVVQPGDNLSLIARKTGISVGTLEALNPNVDPNSLQTAQRLRLRR